MKKAKRQNRLALAESIPWVRKVSITFIHEIIISVKIYLLE